MAQWPAFGVLVITGSNTGRAVFGALTGVSTLAALFLGILLAG